MKVEYGGSRHCFSYPPDLAGVAVVSENIKVLTRNFR